MAKKLSNLDRLQKLANEMKELEKKVKNEKTKANDDFEKLVGKATISYMKKDKDSKELIKETLLNFANAHLKDRDYKKFEKIINSGLINLAPLKKPQNNQNPTT